MTMQHYKAAVHLPNAVFLSLFSLCVLSGQESSSQPALRVVGLNRVKHSIETEMRYLQARGNDLSARYQLFIRNVSDESLPVAPNASPMINGKDAAQWHAEGRLSWYHFPAQDETYPTAIPPGSLMVWQFNGKDGGWLTPSGYSLRSRDLDTVIRDEAQTVYIAHASFTGPESSIRPDKATIHLFNDSPDDFRVEDVVLWHASGKGPWQFLHPGVPLRPSATVPSDGRLRAGGKSIVVLHSEAFQTGHAALQVGMRDANGNRRELWACLKVRKESFDISAGWANDPIGGKPAFLNEGFLKTLKSLYVNAAHYIGQTGYSDDDSLYRVQPLKYFGHLHPWQLYDRDSLLPRIHGIEFLGEPQYGGGTPVDPQKVLTQLLPFAPSRIPTTLTHSEERIWRFYAGLSDYPHFDAYRVSAPSADEWDRYDRWKGRRIAWGAPLETIGNMTRSLKSLNRPVSVAYWSQGPHDGWEVYGGRKLTSPTPSELRAQAYHALSTGITSLYWFNLSYKSLAGYPELLEPMQRIGREIRLLEPFYLNGTQWDYRRLTGKGGPDWDLSTFVSPEGVLLFALDLGYHADATTRTFVFDKERQVDLSLKVPEWVGEGWELWKIEADGLRRMGWRPSTDASIRFRDKVHEVGIYILLPEEAASERLRQRWSDLKMLESSWDFDPARNPVHLREFLGWRGR
jgi:hypothetical protein